MSKLGRIPIKVPAGTKVEVEGNFLKVTGPKGELKVLIEKNMDIQIADEEVKIRPTDTKIEYISVTWGLQRALLNNAVIGVSEGYVKELEMVGVGYRAQKEGNNLKLAIGYSHPVIVKAPENIVFEVEENTKIKVIGVDKQAVGQIAAEIREIRKPEPYKGKGIKYKNEVIKRKQGKAAKSAA